MNSSKWIIFLLTFATIVTGLSSCRSEQPNQQNQFNMHQQPFAMINDFHSLVQRYPYYICGVLADQQQVQLSLGHAYQNQGSMGMGGTGMGMMNPGMNLGMQGQAAIFYLTNINNTSRNLVEFANRGHIIHLDFSDPQMGNQSYRTLLSVLQGGALNMNPNGQPLPGSPLDQNLYSQCIQYQQMWNQWRNQGYVMGQPLPQQLQHQIPQQCIGYFQSQQMIGTTPVPANMGINRSVCIHTHQPIFPMNHSGTSMHHQGFSSQPMIGNSQLYSARVLEVSFPR